MYLLGQDGVDLLDVFGLVDEVVVGGGDPLEGLHLAAHLGLAGPHRGRHRVLVPPMDDLAPLGTSDLFLTPQIFHGGPHLLGEWVRVIPHLVPRLDTVGGVGEPLEDVPVLGPELRLEGGVGASPTPLGPSHVSVDEVVDKGDGAVGDVSLGGLLHGLQHGVHYLGRLTHPTITCEISSAGTKARVTMLL